MIGAFPLKLFLTKNITIMKILILYIIVIFPFVCCVSCDTSQLTQQTNGIYIDVENIDKTFDVTQLCDSIEVQDIIVLETNDDSLIGEVSNISIVDNQIFIIDNLMHGINVFDLNGVFKYQIQHQGRARNEYIEMTDVFIDTNNIYILDNGSQKIVIYNLMGNYEYMIDISNYWAHNIFVVNDAIYLINKWSKTENGMYRLFIIDKNGKLLSKQLAFDEEDCNRYFSEECAYAISNMKNICYPSDNTIYTILENGRCEPFLNIDFQKQAMPSKYTTMDFTETLKNGIHNKYIYGIERITSSSRYLFISYSYLSERYNTIYDYQTHDYHNIKSFNGGSTFNLPLNKFFITDNYLVAYIDANTFLLTIKYSLLDKDERNKYIQQVRRIEQKLSDEDNGILIIHKLKK